jgi:hypothetical protein
MKTILCFILVLVSRFCPGQGPTPVTITSRATFNGDITSAWFIADVSSTQTRKVSGSTILQTAVKYVDTAGMLAPYARAFDYYRKGESDVRYLQSFTESDPIWSAASINYFTKTQSDARYLQSFTETDPIWTAAASTSGAQSKQSNITRICRQHKIPDNPRGFKCDRWIHFRQSKYFNFK